MKGLNSIASSLFEKIRSRFPRIEMGDENGAPTSEESQARFFDFDYVVNNENQGAVSISIKDPDTLKLYYSQGMLENANEAVENAWYNFLKEMRFFSKKHLMGFDAKDIAKSNLDKRDYKYLSNNVQESAMYGSTKSSYENLDKTKLIIRHKKEINAEQMGARARNIQTLFIENDSGERFKYPFNHLAGARAMARHVANGGVPHDEFGSHIIETSGNIAKLSTFKRYVQHKDFMNTTSNDIIEGAQVELDNLRTHVKKLQSQAYYTQQKENFMPLGAGDSELGEDIVNDLTNAFTIPQFNQDLTDMFPLLHKIQQRRISETTVSLDDVLDESNDAIIFKGKEIDTDTIEYDMQDFSDMIFVTDIGVKYTDGTEVDDADMAELEELPAYIDWVYQDYNDRMADQADMYRDAQRHGDFESTNEDRGRGIGTLDKFRELYRKGIGTDDDEVVLRELIQVINDDALFADEFTELRAFTNPSQHDDSEIVTPNAIPGDTADEKIESLIKAIDDDEWVESFVITLMKDFNLGENAELDRIKELAGASIDETYDDDDAFYEAYGEMWYNEDDIVDEAEYQGRKVKLGKPMQGDVKKFKVYVKDPKTGNVKKVNFGHGGSSVKGKAMSIKKSNPKRRKSFRARHNCDNPGPRTKARYWSCRKW